MGTTMYRLDILLIKPYKSEKEHVTSLTQIHYIYKYIYLHTYMFTRILMLEKLIYIHTITHILMIFDNDAIFIDN